MAICRQTGYVLTMKKLAIILPLLGMGLWALPAFAAEPVLIKSTKAWDAFTLGEGNAKVCYMATVPTKSSPKKVNHGTVYVTVSHKPRRQIRDEVNIVVGYNFQTKSSVRVSSGSNSEKLFTTGREAWAYDPAMDGRLVAAMKKGTKLAVSGTSARGTKTNYEFSLFGFSAAYEAISKACKIG